MAARNSPVRGKGNEARKKEGGEFKKGKKNNELKIMNGRRE